MKIPRSLKIYVCLRQKPIIDWK